MFKKFEKIRKFEGKNSQNSVLYSIQWLPDNWPGALDHLAISLVTNKGTKNGKIPKKLSLKLPLPSTVLGFLLFVYFSGNQSFITFDLVGDFTESWNQSLFCVIVSLGFFKRDIQNWLSSFWITDTYKHAQIKHKSSKELF